MTTDERVIQLEKYVLQMISEIVGFREENREQIEKARVELKGDIEQVRVELKNDVEQVRIELKSDIEQIRDELKSDIEQVRVELKSDIQSIDSRLATLEARFIRLVEGIVELAARFDLLETKVQDLSENLNQFQQETRTAFADLRRVMTAAQIEHLAERNNLNEKITKLETLYWEKFSEYGDLADRVAILEKRVKAA